MLKWLGVGVGVCERIYYAGLQDFTKIVVVPPRNITGTQECRLSRVRAEIARVDSDCSRTGEIFSRLQD